VRVARCTLIFTSSVVLLALACRGTSLVEPSASMATAAATAPRATGTFLQQVPTLPRSTQASVPTNPGTLQTATSSPTVSPPPSAEPTQPSQPTEPEAVPTVEAPIEDLKSLPGFVQAMQSALQYMDFGQLERLFGDPVYIQVCGGGGCSTEIVETSRSTALTYLEKQMQWIARNDNPAEFSFEVHEGNVSVFPLVPRQAVHTFRAYPPDADWNLYFGFLQVGDRYYVSDVLLVYPPP